MTWCRHRHRLRERRVVDGVSVLYLVCTRCGDAVRALATTTIRVPAPEFEEAVVMTRWLKWTLAAIALVVVVVLWVLAALTFRG